MFKSRTLILSDTLRQQLKQPLGQLVIGSIPECNRAIKTVIQEENPPRVVLVGDTVSRHALKDGIHADLIIVDNKEMRRSSKPVSLGARKIFNLINSPGTIAGESWDIVSRALNAGDSAVVVDGEEDLLVIVAVSAAPYRSIIVYGQPNVGIVFIRVSGDIKHAISQMLAQMKEVI